MCFSRPSTGTILGGVALFVALGGTALASTGQLVNIADPTTATNLAKVDSSGALKTSGSAAVSGFVGQTIPKNPFFAESFLLNANGGVNTVISANSATVALTRLDLTNSYQQSGAIEVTLEEEAANATTCGGNAASVGTYDVPAGQTFSDAMSSPIVLKPLTPGGFWCLIGGYTVEGNNSTAVPFLSFSG